MWLAFSPLAPRRIRRGSAAPRRSAAVVESA
jgi:hypothetical protein